MAALLQIAANLVCYLMPVANISYHYKKWA
jgi:hypothetical protein